MIWRGKGRSNAKVCLPEKGCDQPGAQGRAGGWCWFGSTGERDVEKTPNELGGTRWMSSLSGQASIRNERSRPAGSSQWSRGQIRSHSLCQCRSEWEADAFEDWGSQGDSAWDRHTSEAIQDMQESPWGGPGDRGLQTESSETQKRVQKTVHLKASVSLF